MPLTTRTVSPVDVSLRRLNPTVQRDELECVANGTLANLIRQLSSLCKHAEQIFTEVHHEVLKIDVKTNTLFLRTARLSQKVLQSDTPMEPVSLEENHMRKAFKSTNLIDQHSLDRQTLPNSLSDTYIKCDPPPQLDLLNPYREDPKSALRYYTDPSYFFDLWKQEMLKECAADRRARSARSPTGANTTSKSPSWKRRNRQAAAPTPAAYSSVPSRPLVSAPVQYGSVRSGEPRYEHYQQKPRNEFMHFPEEYQAPQALRSTASERLPPPPPGMSLHHASVTNPPSHTQAYGYQQQQKGASMPPPPQPIAQPTQFASTPQSSATLEQRMDSMKLARDHTTPNAFNMDEIDDLDELPPPPPPLSSATLANSSLNVTPVQAIQYVPSGNDKVPPPPPPPPMNNKMTASVIQPSTAVASFAARQVDEEAQAAVAEDSAAADTKEGPKTHSNLLMEIQSGIKLKKVQRQEEQAESRNLTESNDVAAILRRRMEQVFGNTDSEEGSNGDDDEWDD